MAVAISKNVIIASLLTLERTIKSGTTAN